MDAKSLPNRPSIEQFRKQAKDLFKARRSAKVIHRLKRFHPRLEKLSEAKIADAKLSLADAESVIAREHGFESWPKFVTHIERLAQNDSQVSKFELTADAIVTGDLVTLEKLLRKD